MLLWLALPSYHQPACSTHLTSSRTEVSGKSGPYRPSEASPSLAVTGLALPYGLPRLFMHTTKNRDVSKAFPGPPSSGPHQSPTSALPVSAWHITMALSPPGASVPYVLYATETLWSTAPDSSVTWGMMANFWPVISLVKGFSGCELTIPVQLLASTLIWCQTRLNLGSAAGGVGGSC
jgi:hypothetical protein